MELGASAHWSSAHQLILAVHACGRWAGNGCCLHSALQRGAAWLANSYKGGWGYSTGHASQESPQASHSDPPICQLPYQHVSEHWGLPGSDMTPPHYTRQIFSESPSTTTRAPRFDRRTPRRTLLAYPVPVPFNSCLRSISFPSSLHQRQYWGPATLSFCHRQGIF